MHHGDVRLSIGFYRWMGSMLGMALAPFMITGSYFMEDNAEHSRLSAQLKGMVGDQNFCTSSGPGVK